MLETNGVGLGRVSVSSINISQFVDAINYKHIRSLPSPQDQWCASYQTPQTQWSHNQACVTRGPSVHILNKLTDVVIDYTVDDYQMNLCNMSMSELQSLAYSGAALRNPYSWAHMSRENVGKDPITFLLSSEQSD